VTETVLMQMLRRFAEVHGLQALQWRLRRCHTDKGSPIQDAELPVATGIERCGVEHEVRTLFDRRQLSSFGEKLSHQGHRRDAAQ
jgi:hypothetical protein